MTPVRLEPSIARRRIVAVLVACLALLVPATAEARVITGSTEDGSWVELRPGGRLVVDWVAFCPRANDNEGGAAYATVPRRLGRRPVALRAKAVRVGASHDQPTSIRLTAARLSRTTWAGTISVGATTVTAHGVTERCRLSRVRWQVTRARGVFTIEGSAEGPVTDAPFYRTTHRRSRLGLYTDGRELSFSAVRRGGPSFVVDVEAAGGDRLGVGRWTDAEEHPFNEPFPGIRVSGPGHACSSVSGEFTVHRLRFDRRGHPRAARISFVYDCYYPTLVRGSFTWRRG